MRELTDQELDRLHELALALIIPWRDGWPQYYMDANNEHERLLQVLEATKHERLPWQF
jgi:hypothetical protein